MVLALLLVGFGFKRRMSFRMHGSFMLAAVALHSTIIGVVMVPSLVALIFEEPAILIGLFAPFHAAEGTTTAILGVWIVVHAA